MEGYGPATYGDRIADVYDAFYEETLDTDRAVEALAELASGGPVLELAIGTGRLALPLVEHGLEVHGIDATCCWTPRGTAPSSNASTASTS
jgi:ubiquinone/menaquinone biosynthesis C-methylase UbiE